MNYNKVKNGDPVTVIGGKYENKVGKFARWPRAVFAQQYKSVFVLLEGHSNPDDVVCLRIKNVRFEPTPHHGVVETVTTFVETDNPPVTTSANVDPSNYVTKGELNATLKTVEASFERLLLMINKLSLRVDELEQMIVDDGVQSTFPYHIGVDEENN
jgi:hypothetical protein